MFYKHVLCCLCITSKNETLISSKQIRVSIVCQSFNSNNILYSVKFLKTSMSELPLSFTVISKLTENYSISLFFGLFMYYPGLFKLYAYTHTWNGGYH